MLEGLRRRVRRVRRRRSAPPPAEVAAGRPGGFGTFGGVFTPSILTILGVIMYLRFGWVVGNVGLVGTLLIVTLATSITFLTALSIAAIATDQQVRIGGAYYMISRSLGLEAGGAIGIPLFLAQALSVALYTVGFAESVVGVFPHLPVKVVGLVTTALVALLALLSARAAIRAQYVIMGAIALSLLSLLFGRPVEPTEIELWGAADRHSEPFWTVFAVFFPAVTGIMAGVNMSGDLAEPSRSIPRGTFAAVGTGYVIYMALPVILALRADALTLIEDPLIMRRIAFWGDAILLGVWGATLSSAVGSILGAPRVLQALARDGILPRPLAWLGRGSGEDDAPRIGTVLTLGLALVAVYLGDLNLIAPVLSMFFLTTYGVLNIAAGVEQFLGSPSFRPTFKVHWAFSLLGAVGCIAVMVLINAAATVVAALFVAAVFVWLQRRGLEAAWGDVRRGLWMALLRSALLRVRSEPDVKNWRPHLLLLSGAPTRRWHLIDLATALTHSRGLMTVSTVLPASASAPEQLQRMERRIRDYLARRSVQALVRVVAAPDPFTGAERLVDAYGLDALVPNTVLLGDSQEPDHRAGYGRMITHFYRSQRNVVIVREGPDADLDAGAASDAGLHGDGRGEDARSGAGAAGSGRQRTYGQRRCIDVWWGGLKGNGGLMLILAHLLQTSLRWQGAEVRLKMVVPTEAARREVQANVAGLVRQTRTGAELEVLVSDGRPFDEILHASSRDADLVFLGMAAPTPETDFAAYYETLQDRTDGLPTTVFVLAGEEILFSELLQ